VQNLAAASFTIKQIQDIIKELGFESPKTIGYFYSFGNNEGRLSYEFTNKAYGSKLILHRRLTQPLYDVPDFGPRPLFQVGAKPYSELDNIPDRGYTVSVSHDEKDHEALLQLAAKMSAQVEKLIRECITEYNSTKNDTDRQMDKVRVHIDGSGVIMESIPGVFDSLLKGLK
jgi:hypothetical protein